MVVRPKNYTWTTFLDYVIDVLEYVFSRQAIARCLMAKGCFSAGTRIKKNGEGSLGRAAPPAPHRADNAPAS